MTINRLTALSGLAASVVFFTALIAVGALDPSYSHFTKAVSELGAIGAPNKLVWNLLGFFAVGILLAIFGWRLGGYLNDEVCRGFLTLFGIAFAATAIPANMDDLGSFNSTAHIVASLAVFLFWSLALLRLLFTEQRLEGLKLASGVALALALGSIVLRGSGLLLPGLAQRISFLVVFGWIIVAAILLLRFDAPDRPAKSI